MSFIYHVSISWVAGPTLTRRVDRLPPETFRIAGDLTMLRLRDVLLKAEADQRAAGEKFTWNVPSQSKAVCAALVKQSNNIDYIALPGWGLSAPPWTGVDNKLTWLVPWQKQTILIEIERFEATELQ